MVFLAVFDHHSAIIPKVGVASVGEGTAWIGRVDECCVSDISHRT